jgi:hypothetical protein
VHLRYWHACMRSWSLRTATGAAASPTTSAGSASWPRRQRAATPRWRRRSPPDPGPVLYTDDRRCLPLLGCRLFLVLLDLRTGDELGRIRVKGTKPPIGQIFIGSDGAVYYPATDTGEANGYLTRVTAA